MNDVLERLRSVLGERYTISREIGRGGMAAVFLAQDRKHDRQVAVKVLHPELAAAIGSDRFLREINIAAQLRHPHIVPLLDSGEADGLLYYVMPYIEGESLRQRLSAHGELDLSEAVRYWRDVIDAIAYAHRHGILHRDIKPENVLLADRHASVVDFGIGKALGRVGSSDSLTGFGMAVGTPAYMAPEQAIASEKVDHRADIYALGVLAYEMLIARVPFPSTTAQQMAAKLTAPAPDVRQDRPEVTEELARLIARCLEPEPEDRWETAEKLLEAVESVVTPPTGTVAATWRRATPRRRNLTIAAVASMATVITAFTWVSMSHARERRWAEETGLPELKRLADTNITDSAFDVARRVRSVLGSDAQLDSVWARVSTTANLHTAPEGAQVYWTAYRGDTASWRLLGETPLKNAEVPQPRQLVNLILKFEKPGYRTIVRPLGVELRSRTPAILDSATPANADAIRIRGGIVAVPNPTRISGDSLRFSDFFIDRFEVTNRQFKQFVAAGGYQRRDLWEYPITMGGRALPWDSAMMRFLDRTGRPGPATWEAGDIPAGRENYPVNGISWYEAAAYAKFAGKSLPTIFHWRRAALSLANAWVLPNSNIGRSSLAPVGAFKAITLYGVHDMAGNVREWCFNADDDMRYILGGGWNENAYIFNDVIRADPMDRSEINGMRLMQRIPATQVGRTIDEADPLGRPVHRGFRDYSIEKPVSDAEFLSFLPIFDYDRTPLNPVVERTDSSDSRWIKQTIAYDAAYAQERMRAYLFLPRHVRPPYQTIVFFPGAGVIDLRSSSTLLGGIPDYVAMNGRAVLYPIYKDTYERGGVESTPMGTDPTYNMTGGLLGPNTYRDHVIMYVKDLRRSVDYLATRADIDTARLAYIGYSWGGRLAPINLSVEHRFKAAVLQIPGLNFAPRRKEVDEFNYLPHLRIPTLVLNGRYDDVFPLQTAAIPFFQHLGVPAAHKRHRVYPTQHFLPRDEMIRETLDWLDRYLGKVGSPR
jgi:eukaryotic-like serine/threonine-protein kinase